MFGRMSFRDWFRLKNTPAPPKVREKKKGTGRAKRRWSIQAPDGEWVVFTAYTRSEARAMAKAAMGITKGRLPANTMIRAKRPKLTAG